MPDVAAYPWDALIRQLYDGGLGRRAIAAKLTATRAPPHGTAKAWHTSAVEASLKRTGGLRPLPGAQPPPSAPTGQLEPPSAAPCTALATIPPPTYASGSLDDLEDQLAKLRQALDRALHRTDRVDAAGVASLGRHVQALSERCADLRRQAAAGSSAGLALEQRLARCSEAARKMPNMLLEIFVLQWCNNNRIDMAALREAKLVRAGEEG